MNPFNTMSVESSEASPVRRYAVLALKIAVSAALLYLLFTKVDVTSLWATARRASVGWLAIALLIYGLNVAASTWRWSLLLDAQHVVVRPFKLLGSFLVASFFNNFLPSNIGGDVVRIADTAKAAGSKTLATTVVLVDRGLGLMALVLVAAVGATIAGRVHPAAMPNWPTGLWLAFAVGVVLAVPAVFAPELVARALRPLTIFHAEWVGDRIEQLTGALAKFRDNPGPILACFAGAVFVQAAMVVFYFAVAYALHLDLALTDLAVIVPISFVVQMLPVSVSGFGVREATFSFYFNRIGHPIASAVLMSLVAQTLIILWSLSGAAVYVARGHQPTAA
jgi:glycosyltransferase 2 family protein